jgi:hypothetical protein
MKILFNHRFGFVKNDRVYCEVYCEPDNETWDELLNMGWNPSMENKGIWYQSRSCRLNVKNQIISKKRNNILNKISYRIIDYQNQKNIDDFFKKFYELKEFNIFNLYENCSSFFKIKVLELFYNNSTVCYCRYVENQESNIFLNLAYEDNLNKLSLGTNSFFILSNITKSQNKNYLYIYESYDNQFHYKENFNNVEIWNGDNWN